MQDKSSSYAINRHGNPVTFRLMQVTPLTNEMKQHTSKAGDQQRLVEEIALPRKQPSINKEDDFPVEILFTAEENSLTIRCLIYNRFQYMLIVTVQIVLICDVDRENVIRCQSFILSLAF